MTNRCCDGFHKGVNWKAKTDSDKIESLRQAIFPLLSYDQDLVKRQVRQTLGHPAMRIKDNAALYTSEMSGDSEEL